MYTTRQKIEALALAERTGTKAPEWAKLGANIQNRALNNLNIKSGFEFKSLEYSRNFSNLINLNNLRPEQESKGIARIEPYTDETLKKAISWGVEEWLVQVCIREYGIYTVKAQINRIYQLPDGYFKPKYGPIAQQRGRIFNKEMQKLKCARQAN